jgi:hypothetical protein
MTTTESQIEQELIEKLTDLKYSYREDIAEYIRSLPTFDGDALRDLMAPLELGWKARAQKELALVEDLTPLLHKLAKGREISGLNAYEQ